MRDDARADDGLLGWLAPDAGDDAADSVGKRLTIGSRRAAASAV